MSDEARGRQSAEDGYGGALEGSLAGWIDEVEAVLGEQPLDGGERGLHGEHRPGVVAQPLAGERPRHVGGRPPGIEPDRLVQVGDRPLVLSQVVGGVAPVLGAFTGRVLRGILGPVRHGLKAYLRVLTGLGDGSSCAVAAAATRWRQERQPGGSSGHLYHPLVASTPRPTTAHATADRVAEIIQAAERSAEQIRLEAEAKLQERVAELEKQIEELKAAVNAEKKSEGPWWKRVAGTFPNDEVYEEYLEILRRTGRPTCQRRRRQRSQSTSLTTGRKGSKRRLAASPT